MRPSDAKAAAWAAAVGLCFAQLAACCEFDDPVNPDGDTCASFMSRLEGHHVPSENLEHDRRFALEP